MAVAHHEGYLPGVGRVQVRIDGSAIESVVVVEQEPYWRPELAESGLLLPGLVDLQVNGVAGIDFGDPAVGVDEVLEAARHLWSFGVTAFCPTLITAPLDRMQDRLRTLDRARESSIPGAESLRGAHLEGPWISAEDGARGAHPRAHVSEPHVDEALTLVAAGDVAIVTLAPELPGSVELIQALRGAGVLVSLGHSAAAAHQIRPAVEAGATLSTHLGNGVTATLPRHPNLLWEQLAEDRLTAMFIADLHHLDVSTLSAMIRAKGEDRVVFVSDMTSIGGLAPGIHETWIGGTVELTVDGRLSVAGSSYLAGAAMPLIDGLSHALSKGVLAPDKAIRAVSANPRAVIEKNDASPEILSPGATADLVLAEWTADRGITPVETIIAGRSVWSAS